MIQQSANQNATNSELDAKKIVTHSELTSAQRNELIEQYVDIVVDNMDWKTLAVFVTEELQYRFRNDYTDDELREEINNCDEELYDELVDNVTQQYPKQLNTFEKETFIDINNQGGQS